MPARFLRLIASWGFIVIAVIDSKSILQVLGSNPAGGGFFGFEISRLSRVKSTFALF